MVVSVEQNSSNKFFFHSVPSRFLNTFHSKPQITLKKDGLLGNCFSDCSVTIIADSQVPVVQSYTVNADTIDFTMASASSSLADYALLTQADIEVEFAKFPCVVSSVSLPDFTCTKSKDANSNVQAVAGSFKPKVHLKNRGYLKWDSGATATEIPFAITSVSPSNGSVKGGAVLTISGTGFDSTSVVKIQDVACPIISYTNSEIKCTTPAAADFA